MPTEDGSGLYEQVLADSRRKGTCSACDWIESRPPDEQSVWDKLMALTWRDANSAAIWRAMKDRGFEKGSKVVDEHRRRKHRASD